MITALVQFTLPEPITRERARELFLQSAPRFQAIRGLIRKYYVLSEDGASAGGVYLWQTRAAAEEAYSPEWASAIRQKYGSTPLVTYFETPVVVDNQTSEVIRA